MQSQTIYFSIHFTFPSPHPDYDATAHFVGEALCVSVRGDLIITISKCFIAIDPNVNDTPAAYCQVDAEANDFKNAGRNNRAYDAIIFDVCERFGKVDADNADAKTICDYYSQRDAIGEKDSVK